MRECKNKVTCEIKCLIAEIQKCITDMSSCKLYY
jgi:hypothetical protein